MISPTLEVKKAVTDCSIGLGEKRINQRVSDFQQYITLIFDSIKSEDIIDLEEHMRSWDWDEDEDSAKEIKQIIERFSVFSLESIVKIWDITESNNGYIYISYELGIENPISQSALFKFLISKNPKFLINGFTKSILSLDEYLKEGMGEFFMRDFDSSIDYKLIDESKLAF
jgi:hypothetical protein